MATLPAETPIDSRLRGKAFAAYWQSRIASNLGSEIGGVAIPIIAVLWLKATPFDVALMTGARYTPSLLGPLFVGQIVDRFRRTPVLISVDLLRGLALAVLIAVGLAGGLSIPLLVAYSLALGAANVLSGASSGAIVRDLTDVDNRFQANAKLEAANGAIAFAGPLLGGFLVKAIGPLGIMIIDSVSFFVGAWRIRSLRRLGAKPAGRAASKGEGYFHHTFRGFSVLTSIPKLAGLTYASGMFCFVSAISQPLLAIYVFHDLKGSTVFLAALLASGAVGGVVVASVAKRLAKVANSWNVIALSIIGASMADIGLLASRGQPRIAMYALCAAGFFIGQAAVVVFASSLGALRQQLVPDAHFGATTAAYRFYTTGSIVGGALIGGLLGNAFSVAAAVAVSAIGQIIVAGLVLWIFGGRSHPGDPTPAVAQEGFSHV
jgi:MFS family permease